MELTPNQSTTRTTGTLPHFEQVRTPTEGIPSESIVGIRFKVHAASSVLLEGVGYIGDGYKIKAPRQTTTYTLRASNIHGEAVHRFTITIDNTPKLPDTRPKSVQLREQLVTVGQTLANAQAETADRLRERGGLMAEAALAIRPDLQALRYVCRPSTLQPGARSKPHSFAKAVYGIGRMMSSAFSAAEGAIMSAPGWEPPEEDDTDLRDFLSRCGILCGQAATLQDELHEETRKQLEGIPA